MQDWEKELKNKRIQEINHIEKSFEENLYAKNEKRQKIFNVLQKAYGKGQISEDVLKKSISKLID